MSYKVDWHKKHHPNPSERLPALVKEFGKPTMIDRKKGGVAIWNKAVLTKRHKPWERIELHDEMIPHGNPANHFDFMYTWFQLDVPKSKICKIISLSDSVTYDPLKKLIRARCHHMGPNTSTLLLAMYVATGKMTITQAKKNYGPYIMRTIESSKTYDPKAIKDYEKELYQYYKKNKQKFKKQHLKRLKTILGN